MPGALDFMAEARRRKSLDDEDYIAAQQREWAADDTRRASMDTIKSLNSSGYPLIGGPTNRLAPASGYLGARDYYQGLDDQQTIAKHNGGSFPKVRVENFVTNRSVNPVAAHGTADMPVWGPIFQSLDSSDARVKVRIANVVAYVESIQAK